jgi:hypothetical protein
LHDRRFRHPTSISGEKAWLAECADEEARLKAAYDAEEQAHPLPEGWHKIKHEPSGLDSYVHRQSGAVCWTRPYVIPPTTDNEEEHLKSIATHEIPLFPFAMILQLTELVARVETNRLYSSPPCVASIAPCSSSDCRVALSSARTGPPRTSPSGTRC